jgi:hypothetical protein
LPLSFALSNFVSVSNIGDMFTTDMHKILMNSDGGISFISLSRKDINQTGIYYVNIDIFSIFKYLVVKSKISLAIWRHVMSL